MLKSVLVVFCLFCLSCFATTSPPPCANLNVTNCAPYYCVVNQQASSQVCAADPCFGPFNSSGVCQGTGSNVCKRNLFILNGDSSNAVGTCSSQNVHFSDCRITTQALSDVWDDDDDNFPAMENFCKDLGCGGVYMYFDKDNNIYFHCEEPYNDGTEGPDDFDVSNCKKFEYKVNGTKCDWDPCANYNQKDDDGNLINSDNETCSSSSDNCKELVVDEQDGSKLCVRANETVCGVGSWNLDILTNDGCADKGCGGLDVAISKNKNSYKFCLPPPPTPVPPECPKKNGAVYLRVSTIILAITIFAFL